MPWSGERGPLLLRSASSAFACSIALGFSVITVLIFGPLLVVRLDAREIHRHELLGRERPRLEGAIQISDARTLEIERCCSERQRRKR